MAFDPNLMEYSQDYENSLHFSPRFQVYAAGLATRLIERYSLHGKTIIEIGSGSGDFLKLLCELGDNRGIGFDPSYSPQPEDGSSTERLTFIPDFYSERHAHHWADFICSRHTLEHMQDPGDFLATLRRSIGDRSDTVVFFEVPNALYTLRDLGIWDIIYEHCSYYCSNSLARVFSDSGFSILKIGDAFEGQFLYVEALPSTDSVKSQPDSLNDLRRLSQYVAAFSRNFRSKQNSWRSTLQELKRDGQKAVIWGSGSKGVTFLNTLGVIDQIEVAVDINPRKHGRYIAGTGQRIVPPEFLRDYRPDLVIIMNAVYRAEIRERMDDLGLTARLMCA
jgi:hypothetical protein